MGAADPGRWTALGAHYMERYEAAAGSELGALPGHGRGVRGRGRTGEVGLLRRTGAEWDARTRPSLRSPLLRQRHNLLAAVTVLCEDGPIIFRN